MENIIKLDQIQTTKVNIVNMAILNNEEILININNTVTRPPNTDFCTCNSSIEIFMAKESSSTTKTFLISVEIQGNFSIVDSSISRDDLHPLAVKELYPHLRASLHSIMASCGIAPLLLPPTPPIQ